MPRAVMSSKASFLTGSSSLLLRSSSVARARRAATTDTTIPPTTRTRSNHTMVQAYEFGPSSRSLREDRLTRPCGPAEGAPLAGPGPHIHRDVIHHGAEIRTVPDLYAPTLRKGALMSLPVQVTFDCADPASL